MSTNEPRDPSEHKRRGLQLDAFIGFLGFFAFLSVIQAVINVFQPEPKVWPALLALVLVLATVSMWRARRDRSPRTEA
ncbi:MAG: hypothetical protein GX983_08930 [Corynebacterium sp.]|nr:hypothetical protein [Corynebacterium sp.]